MSSSVAEISRRVRDYQLETNPFLRLRQGLPVTQLRAGSLGESEADASFADRVLADLAAVPHDSMTHDETVTAGFLRFVVGAWTHGPGDYWLGFSCAPYSSYFASFVTQQVFGGFAFRTSDDVEQYLSLITDYRNYVSEMGVKLTGQRERGIQLPRPAITGARETLRRHQASTSALHVNEERLEHLDAATRARLRSAVDTLVEDEVSSAFDRVLAVLDADYETSAPGAVGVAQFPGGEEFYRHAVRQHTASAATPEDLHQVGLSQVADLAEAMAKVRAELGFSGSESDFHAQLAADPRFFASDATQVEARYLAHAAALKPKLGRWFSVLPRAEYGVARLAPELEAGMTYGYYQPPTKLEPVGKYMFNGSDLENRSMLTSAALILHELAPGHHFHLARQAENESLPDVRREAIEIGAFNEGWAEYAAGLGLEMGLYEDPYDRYGRLVHERFTAQRLVIDTGLNLLDWTLDKARGYMRANTTESELQVASETLRYSTDLPGQALAYRSGYIEFSRLRANAESALGDRFDVREFHEAILNQGALPFPVLANHLQWWTDRQLG